MQGRRKKHRMSAMQRMEKTKSGKIAKVLNESIECKDC